MDLVKEFGMDRHYRPWVGTVLSFVYIQRYLLSQPLLEEITAMLFIRLEKKEEARRCILPF